jgi:hypothetical protein
MIQKLRLAIRNDLEVPEELRRFGSGWLSGVAALVLGIASLCLLLGERLQGVFSTQMLAPLYALPQFTLIIQGLLVASFILACTNLILRRNRILGFSAIVLVLVTMTIAQTLAAQAARNTSLALSLDWFVLNILLTGLLFIPLEKLFGRLTQQALFRDEWREDLFYFLISSVFVQTLTLFTLAPSMTVLHYTGDWATFRDAVASQPLWLQVIEIMPFLWGFHAVHHSAKKMDWLAGSRMHIVEIIGLRSMTVIPMYVLGFAEAALHIYILLVYLNATFVHANVRFNVEWLKPFIVTPRFHHWHHGIEKEAIDVNFAIHFPLFDKLFGTYYMPKNQWPSGYGIGGHPVPNGYWKQLLYPFKK